MNYKTRIVFWLLNKRGAAKKDPLFTGSDLSVKTSVILDFEDQDTYLYRTSPGKSEWIFFTALVS